MNAFANNNPEVLEKFLRAIDKANIFIINNKQESQEIVAERLNLDNDVVALQCDEFTFKLSLDQSLLINIESEARWAINQKQYGEWVYD